MTIDRKLRILFHNVYFAEHFCLKKAVSLVKPALSKEFYLMMLCLEDNYTKLALSLIRAEETLNCCGFAGMGSNFYLPDIV